MTVGPLYSTDGTDAPILGKGTRLGSGPVNSLVSGVWPQRVNGKGASFLESHEARIGTSVGVLDGGRRPGSGFIAGFYTFFCAYGH